MAVYRDLWKELCSYKNIELAFKNARKHKTLKPYVIQFEKDLKSNLSLLRTELLLRSYTPKPLETFILRDPKTRKISKSDFRDRVVHHALCNVIEPLFEKCFISDSYANRVGKGTLKAVERFEYFKGKVTHNFTAPAFVLKVDVRHYFEEVDHTILLRILQKKIKDKRVLWLIRKILNNYSTKEGKSMPLGNLTSQFFANIYLNELDHFVKHTLRVKFYIRYVDDFVVLHNSEAELEKYLYTIRVFLRENLALELHPTKSRIVSLHCGTEFLGLKIFSHHKLIKLKNVRKFYRKFNEIYQDYDRGKISYDSVYDFMEGWMAYAQNADTYLLRKRVASLFEERFPCEISTKEINRHLKEEEMQRKRRQPPVKVKKL
jgi:retron-type reverse transcriptase